MTKVVPTREHLRDLQARDLNANDYTSNVKDGNCFNNFNGGLGRQKYALGGDTDDFVPDDALILRKNWWELKERTALCSEHLGSMAVQNDYTLERVM